MSEYLAIAKTGIFSKEKFFLFVDDGKIKGMAIGEKSAPKCSVFGVGKPNMNAVIKGGVPADDLIGCEGKSIFYSSSTNIKNCFTTMHTPPISAIKRLN